MTPDDLAQVCAIENCVFTDAWSEKGFRESLENDSAVMLCAAEGEVIAGYCCMYTVADEGEIVNVAVHPDFRRQGIGGQMLEYLLERGRRRGVVHFYLEVRAGNIPAQQLYGKSGFKVAGIRKNFYEKPVENAFVMML